jgi:hypothetical protein
MHYEFKAFDHPEANGREAQQGEECFPMRFKTDDCGELVVRLGRRSFVSIAACVLRTLQEDRALAKEVAAVAKEVEAT